MSCRVIPSCWWTLQSKRYRDLLAQNKQQVYCFYQYCLSLLTVKTELQTFGLTSLTLSGHFLLVLHKSTWEV